MELVFGGEEDEEKMVLSWWWGLGTPTKEEGTGALWCKEEDDMKE